MNIFRMIGVGSLLLTYCLAVGLGCFSALEGIPALRFSSEKSGTYLAVDADYSNHTGIVKRTNTHTALKTAESTQQHLLPGIGLDFRSATGRWQAGLKQYSCFAVNLPIRLRKADLIFPFHYFW